MIKPTETRTKYCSPYYIQDFPPVYEISSMLINKTFIYLYPALSLHEDWDEELLEECGVKYFVCGDMKYLPELSKKAKGGLLPDEITAVCIRNKLTEAAINVMIRQPYCDRYYFINDHSIAIVFSLPVQHVVHKMIKGQYSKLYPEQLIEQLFPPYGEQLVVVNTDSGIVYRMEENGNHVSSVLKKDPEYFNLYFKKILESDFNIEVDYSEDMELDYPPCLSTEMLNFDKSIWKSYIKYKGSEQWKP